MMMKKSHVNSTNINTGIGNSTKKTSNNSNNHDNHNANTINGGPEP